MNNQIPDDFAFCIHGKLYGADETMKIDNMACYVIGQFLGGILVGTWIQPHSFDAVIMSGELAIVSFAGLLSLEAAEGAYRPDGRVDTRRR